MVPVSAVAQGKQETAGTPPCQGHAGVHTEGGCMRRGRGARLRRVEDSADAGCDAAAEQADDVQGSRLVYFGHALLVHHRVLRERGRAHLHAGTLRGPNQAPRPREHDRMGLSVGPEA